MEKDAPHKADVAPEVKSYLANTILATALGAGAGYILGLVGDSPQRKVGQFFLPILGAGFGFFLSTFAAKKLDKRPYDLTNAPDAVINNQRDTAAGTELLPGSTAMEFAHEGVVAAAPQRQTAL